MNCNESGPLISAMIDDELTDAELMAVRDHLGACEGCRDYERGLLASRRALTSHLSLSAPAGFEASVLDALDSRASTRSVRRSLLDAAIDFMRPGWRQIAVSTAAALVIAALLLLGTVPQWQGGSGDASERLDQYLRAADQSYPYMPEHPMRALPAPPSLPSGDTSDRKGAMRWSDATHTS